MRFGYLQKPRAHEEGWLSNAGCDEIVIDRPDGLTRFGELGPEWETLNAKLSAGDVLVTKRLTLGTAIIRDLESRGVAIETLHSPVFRNRPALRTQIPCVLERSGSQLNDGFIEIIGRWDVQRGVELATAIAIVNATTGREVARVMISPEQSEQVQAELAEASKREP